MTDRVVTTKTEKIILVQQSPKQVIKIVQPPLKHVIKVVDKGPKGDKGDPGETVDIEEFIGDPNTNFVTMYQIFKL